VLYDWGGGLVWLLTAPGLDLRARLGAIDGHATLIRSDSAIPAFAPQAPGIAALTAGLRAKFDPKGILNPGLMG
jgi:glycolate oxidase FAD binding subunit